MVEQITPKKNPFFAGPQTGAQPKPVQPQAAQPRVQPSPAQPKPIKPPVRANAKQNKKVLMIAGVVVAVIVVGVILFFLLGTFGSEVATKI
jgi:hypothetical protein